TSPVAAAGRRTEPPPSEPIAAGSSPALTAAAAPPDDPPAPMSCCQGERAGTCANGSVYPARPNSEVLVLPRLTDPASSSSSAASSLVSGTHPAKSREPKPLGTPARLTRSLSASGRPQSGP